MSVSLETFYSSLIIEELEKYGCNNDKLIAAFDAVEEVYSSSALKTGDTYLDYNNTWNRCAYLCKFGIIHTGMVRKYFKKLVINATVKNNLKSKSSIKICCLGGGAGTDVVGIFKVLSKYPDFYGKVVQVTVLDICGGWRISFNEVMSRMVGGKVKNIPSDFVDAGKFVYKLIQVDLLGPLPSNVVQILAESDVVCMVKFVSAVTGKPGAKDALKVILEALKLESVLFLIDNNYGEIVTSMETIANSCTGLRMIIGPMHSTFASAKRVSHEAMKKSNKKSLTKLRVYVMGWIKKSITSEVCAAVAQEDNESVDEEDCWETDSSSASDCDIA